MHGGRILSVARVGAQKLNPESRMARGHGSEVRSCACRPDPHRALRVGRGVAPAFRGPAEADEPDPKGSLPAKRKAPALGLGVRESC